MTMKTPEKKRARALQEQTGWTYSECLRLVREKTEDQIDQVIAERAKKIATAQLQKAGLRGLRTDVAILDEDAGFPEDLVRSELGWSQDAAAALVRAARAAGTSTADAIAAVKERADLKAKAEAGTAE